MTPVREHGQMPGHPNVFADYPDLTGDELLKALTAKFGVRYAAYETAHRTLVAHCYECSQCYAAKTGGAAGWCEDGWPLARAWLALWLPFPDGSTALEREDQSMKEET